MGSKLNPAPFDCFSAALADEEMFTLLARDRAAPYLVAIWAALRDADQHEARDQFNEMLEKLGPHYWASPEDNADRIAEAFSCAEKMRSWRTANEGRWREPVVATHKIPGQTGLLVQVDAQGIATARHGEHEWKQALAVGITAAFLGADPRHPGRGVFAFVENLAGGSHEEPASVLFAMSPAGIEALAARLEGSAERIRRHSAIDMRQIV